VSTTRWLPAVGGLLALGLAACTMPPSTAAPRAEPPPTGHTASAAASSVTPGPLAPLPARVRLHTGYTTASASMAGLWAAAEGGYFTQHGLDAEVTFVRAGAEVLAAIANGEVPLAVAGGLSLVGAALEGSDHVIVGGMNDRLAQALYAAPQIPDVPALRGQTIGVSRYGAITHLAALKILEHYGLRAGEDVNIVQTGGVPESLAAVQTGAVQAAMLTPPNTLHARKAGLRLLIDTGDLNIPDLGTAIGTTRRYVREQPAVVEHYLAAIIEGLHRFLTDREFGLQVIGKYTRTDDREALLDAYEYYAPFLVRDLEPSLAGLQSQLDELADTKPAARTARPEQFLDKAPLERVRATGLVERLYGTQR